MEAHVTDAEPELLQETAVVHHVKGREDIEPFLSVMEEGAFVWSQHIKEAH